MKEEAQQKKGASMLVLANSIESFQTLSDILRHYFPQTPSGHLHLATKYYTAKIRLAHSFWPSLLELNPQGLPIEEVLETQSQPQNKEDLLIMLVSSGQSFGASTYDLVVHRYNPDNFMLIVDTKNKEEKWIGEDVISGEVNNFIEIIKEDLSFLKQNLPERTQKGLLNDHYEDGSIFNLLELMETTQWAQIQRIQQTNHKIQSNSQSAQPKIDNKEPNENIQAKNTNQQERKGKEQEVNEEISEEQLEQQMNNFQVLMKEMMNLRTNNQSESIPHEQRKKAAQNIMQKLLGGSFL